MRLLHCCQHGRRTSSESQIMLNFPSCFPSLPPHPPPQRKKKKFRGVYSPACAICMHTRARAPFTASISTPPPPAPRRRRGRGRVSSQDLVPREPPSSPLEIALFWQRRTPSPFLRLVGGAAGVFLAALAIKWACWLLNGHEEHRAVCVRPARPP